MKTAIKTAKVAPKAELTFDVDGTGTDGREGQEDKISSETSGQSFEQALNNVNIGKISASCKQIDQDSLQCVARNFARNGQEINIYFYMPFCFDLNYRANERNFQHA